MAMTFDFSGDPADVWDNTETILYVAPGGERSIEITVAMRLNISRIISNQGITVEDCEWFLAGASFADAVTPTVGGTIRAYSDNSSWIILSQDYDQLDQVWGCNCRNFTPAGGNQMANVISIVKPFSRQDVALGRVVIDYLPKQTGIAAFINEAESQTVNERGRRLQQKQYKVFVAEAVDMTHEDLMRDETGKLYEFVSSNASSLDQLQVLTVRRTADATE